MPHGTAVDRCYQKLKDKPGINAAAVCQASTHQSLRTGKPIKSFMAKLKKNMNRGPFYL